MHGLRPADLIHSKSDVYVEVTIEGKDDSIAKVTTPVVVGKAAQRVGAEPGEKDSVEVELNFVGELPNYIAGDKIVFTVKDKDFMTSDYLGKAVVTDAHFGGRIDLEGAGEGYKAFMMVQLGDGKGMEEAIDHFKKTIEETTKKLAAAAAHAAAAAELAAKGDVKQAAQVATAAAQEAAKATQEAATETIQEVQNSGCVSCW